MDNKYQYAAAAGRMLLAAIFLWSGFGKLMSYEGTVGYISSVGMPAPSLAYIAAVIVELIGGIALVIGFKTRWAASALALFSVVAALGFHATFGDLNQLIHFMKNIAIAGGLLYVIAFGAGAISLDARRKTA